MSRITQFIGDALHLIYPNVCICCEQMLTEEEQYICKKCNGEFDRFSMPNESSDEMLVRLQGNFPGQKAISDAVSCYRYHKDGLLQKAIHSMKYEGLRSLAVQFGRALGEKILKERTDAKYEAIVPVPLHRIKKIERGYNQSELLATGISAELQIPVLAGAIERVKYTTSQTGFNLSKRTENMSEAFRCPNELNLTNVLLVDDVFTTGSTLFSAAQPLQNAGVGKITIATLAVAQS